MKIDALTNATVKAAVEALQRGDQKAWSALFEPDAELYDDGSPRSLKEFACDALGHERFRSIDRVENNGLELTGEFHSDQGAISSRTSIPSDPCRQDKAPRYRTSQWILDGAIR